MSGIKYYQLKEDEELPDEFCAVKDVNGEPSEYTFYRPETENAKLRELCRDMYRVMFVCDDSKCPYGSECIDNLGNPDEVMSDCKFKRLMCELGIEVGV